jgi:hypothetical protein
MRIAYLPGYNGIVLKALDSIIDSLGRLLMRYEHLTNAIDKEASEHPAMLFLGGVVKSDKDLEAAHEERRNSDSRVLGHILKRRDEVKALKEAWETRTPSQEQVEKIFAAIKSCMLHDSMRLTLMSPEREPDEFARLEETTDNYAAVLSIVFGLIPMAWEEFPLDLPPEEEG